LVKTLGSELIRDAADEQVVVLRGLPMQT